MNITTTGKISLAEIIRDYGQRWVIEHIEGAAARWVAVQRDDEEIHVIGAHDLGALRYRLTEAERGDPAGQEADLRPAVRSGDG